MLQYLPKFKVLENKTKNLKFSAWYKVKDAKTIIIKVEHLHNVQRFHFWCARWEAVVPVLGEHGHVCFSKLPSFLKIASIVTTFLPKMQHTV